MLTTDVPLSRATPRGEQEDKEVLGTSIPGSPDPKLNPVYFTIRRHKHFRACAEAGVGKQTQSQAEVMFWLVESWSDDSVPSEGWLEGSLRRLTNTSSQDCILTPTSICLFHHTATCHSFNTE